MSIDHGGNLEKLAAEAHCAPDEILDFSDQDRGRLVRLINRLHLKHFFLT